MGGILTCGPFAATMGESKEAMVTFAIGTQGDWIGTEEGHDEMDKVQMALDHATMTGQLPDDLVIDWKSEDQLVVRIPCESWADAMKKGPEMKELIPEITGATVTKNIRLSK